MTALYDPNADAVMGDTLAMRITDAAKALSIGRTTVYQLINDGTLQTIKVGRRRLILTKSIHQLCGQTAVPPRAPSTTRDVPQRYQCYYHSSN